MCGWFVLHLQPSNFVQKLSQVVEVKTGWKKFLFFHEVYNLSKICTSKGIPKHAVAELTGSVIMSLLWYSCCFFRTQDLAVIAVGWCSPKLQLPSTIGTRATCGTFYLSILIGQVYLLNVLSSCVWERPAMSDEFLSFSPAVYFQRQTLSSTTCNLSTQECTTWHINTKITLSSRFWFAKFNLSAFTDNAHGY